TRQNDPRSANGFGADPVLPGGDGGVNAPAATVCADMLVVFGMDSDARLSHEGLLVSVFWLHPYVTTRSPNRNGPVATRVRRLTRGNEKLGIWIPGFRGRCCADHSRVSTPIWTVTAVDEGRPISLRGDLPSRPE